MQQARFQKLKKQKNTITYQKHPCVPAIVQASYKTILSCKSHGIDFEVTRSTFLKAI